MSNITKRRLDDEIPEEFNNLADRTAQDMVVDHLWSCYELIRSVQPSICGFKATLIDDGENSRVELDIMKMQP